MSETVPVRYQVGERVRVRHDVSGGHLRTPHYCRGHTGVIERVCGSFPNPEELAFGHSGLPSLPLYRVRFRSRELWPDYQESENDMIEIEIFQHWLEADHV